MKILKYLRRPRITHPHLMTLFILSGCAYNEDITNQDPAKEIANKCYQAQSTLTVYSREAHSSVEYRLFPPDFPPSPRPTRKKSLIQWTSEIPSWDPSFIIDKNDILRIVKVTNELRGTNGHCWHIIATVDKNPFIEFELPSCWMHHTNLWFTPDSPYELSIDKERDAITLVSDYIKLTQCPLVQTLNETPK
ncbi:hypothetical protein [uncultured Shewanella sp.]|uniref:hypothetical protein n=1 Tax=uncultured Shewanella sp. TaxID=173975 RepID=UPI0026291F2E|nr:hypothetical protein [uncultured Shewanella sp.]